MTDQHILNLLPVIIESNEWTYTPGTYESVSTTSENNDRICFQHHDWSGSAFDMHISNKKSTVRTVVIYKGTDQFNLVYALFRNKRNEFENTQVANVIKSFV